MDPPDREKFRSDTDHFHPEGIDMQAKMISDYVLAAPGLTDAAAAAEHAQTETGPCGGIR